MEQDTGGYWLLNEKELRAALGQTTKQRTDVETERWERLANSQIIVGRHVYPAPTVRERAITSAGQAHWSIDPALVEQWISYEQTRAVYVPLRLLQLAKSKTTIMLALRALAWRAGAAPVGSVRAGDDNSSTIRLGVDELRSELGLDPEIETKYLVRDHLAPAAAEIEKMQIGLSVTIAPVWSLKYPQPATIRRRNQILGFDLHLGWNNAELTPAAKQVPFAAMRRRAIEQSKKRRPKPAPLFDQTTPADDNVVQFKPEPGFHHLKL